MPASKRKRRQSDEHNRASREGAQQRHLRGSKEAVEAGTDASGSDDQEDEPWRSHALTKLADMPRDMVKCEQASQRLTSVTLICGEQAD